MFILMVGGTADDKVICVWVRADFDGGAWA